MSITFSTCFYNLKSKFDETTYVSWFDNMLSNVNNYFLVLYTDENTVHLFKKYETNEKIKIIIKPFEQFYFYKYEKEWLLNHKKNSTLNHQIDWKLVMLWCEKIPFVNETIKEKYFETEIYGWCDIGYFRNRENDMKKNELTNWPDKEIVDSLDKNKIHYARVNNYNHEFNNLQNIVLNKNEYELPIQPIPENQVSIGGGFFICHSSKINWWLDTFEKKLVSYFDNNYLVKDDQMIIINCYFLEEKHFELHCEYDNSYDIWFMFQRLLL